MYSPSFFYKSLIFSLSFFLATIGFAETFILPDKGLLIGEQRWVYPEANDNLISLGYRYNIGSNEVRLANPHINSKSILPLNLSILLPTQHILPKEAKEGIVINLAEYRLYYYPHGDNTVISMPVGIGRKGWNTPVGRTSIVSKEQNPIWRPSKKLQYEGELKGQIIPDEFPANEANPLGKYVLRLGFSSYLIHGSNRYAGVGERASAGCIRLLPDDIEYLYQLVLKGTKVLIIDEPLKLSINGAEVYIQVYPIINKNKGYSVSLLNKIKAIKNINKKLLERELVNPSGLVRRIS
ncbi:MAG: L,D-transpeptidase family protein [Proteobacteria bacterium]|nr:L,D-transpeptidase family protein [Pseudomonadota bacterium]